MMIIAPDSRAHKGKKERVEVKGEYGGGEYLGKSVTYHKVRKTHCVFLTLWRQCTWLPVMLRSAGPHQVQSVKLSVILILWLKCIVMKKKILEKYLKSRVLFPCVGINTKLYIYVFPS